MKGKHMITRKLGMNVCGLGAPSRAEGLEIMKKVGFDCFFTGAFHYDEVAELREKADALGLDFDFIHGPFQGIGGINAMWLPGVDYRQLFNDMKECIDSAFACGVPTVVIHVSSGWNAPQVNDLGLSRYDELVLYAQQKGVRIAFENLRKLGNVAYFADRYENLSHVGFCFDCGHEHCYTPNVCWQDIFSARLLCTHLHDNHGPAKVGATEREDEHLLPFDGTYDFTRMIRKLDEYVYTGSLMMELSRQNPQYECMTPEEFATEAYARVKKMSLL